ncbi:MAG: hypothetical protein ACYC96_00270 [Fimbriimonadaceae bacterium]
MLYAEPRFTKDIDVFLAADAENVNRFGLALTEFGFPIPADAEEEMSKPDRMISIGHPPSRIDFLNTLSGIDFDGAWPGRKVVDIEGVPVTFIGLAALIDAKRAAGRPQDLIDLADLEKSKESN